MASGTFSGWSETILLILAVIGVLGVIIVNMNGLYNQDHQIGLGLNTTASDFIDLQDNAVDNVRGGDVDTSDSDSGISLSSSWGITKNVFNVLVSFVTGSFIQDIAVMTQSGEAGLTLAFYLRIIFVLTLVFGILYLIFGRSV